MVANAGSDAKVAVVAPMKTLRRGARTDQLAPLIAMADGEGRCTITRHGDLDTTEHA